MNIRLEQPDDYLAVERLTLAAFETFTFPDGSKEPYVFEHYLAHPDYYPRFGFKPASDFGLTMPDGSVIDPFMALELVGGYLGTDGGKWYEDEVYEIDQTAFECVRQFIH